MLLIPRALVRRSHPSQSKQLRCQRLCKEVRWIFPVLGSHLVSHLPCLYGHWHRWWDRSIPSVIQPTRVRFAELHLDSLVILTVFGGIAK